MENLKVDLLIKNGLILTMDSSFTVYQNGYLAVKGGKISALGDGEPPFEAVKTIDAQGSILLPGLINTHAHSAMTMFRGFADDLELMEWLNGHIWPAEAKFINAKNVQLGTELAAAEMIKSGTTLFNDMYFFEKESATVCEKAGIKAVLGEGILDLPAPLIKTSAAYPEEILKEYANHPLIRGAVTPHSPYTCSADSLLKARELSERYEVPLHIHIAESEFEFNKFQSEHGLTPVAYLERIGFLSSRTVAVHSVYLTDDDLDLYAKNFVKVSHNLKSNAKLANGVARVWEMLKRGITVSLGTDSAASNNTLDLFSEMSFVAKIHKAIAKNPTILDARTVLAMATIEGAKTLGMEQVTGSLEAGKEADLIIINTDKPHLTPLYNPYSQLVYSANGADVETVIINGKIVMENRVLLTLNEERIKSEMRGLSKQINSSRLLK